MQDGLVKCQCGDCGEEFIIGEHNSETRRLFCPFCKSEYVEAHVWMPRDDDRNLELGCLGIYRKE